MKSKLRLAVLFALMSFSDESFAGINAYTDKVRWTESLRGTFLTETFDNYLVSNYGSAQMTSGINISSTPHPHGFLVNSAGTTVWNDQIDPGDTTVFDFPQPIYAFGGTFDPVNLTSSFPAVKFMLDSMLVPSRITHVNRQFFGVVSTTPFSRVTISVDNIGNGAYQDIEVDDLVYAMVPEPSTLALAAFGFVALAWRWRKR